MANFADINTSTPNTSEVASTSLSLIDGRFDNLAGALTGTSTVNAMNMSKLNTALDANAQAITNINIDSGAIDGVSIGTNSAITQLVVDNIDINLNTISTTSGNLILTPIAGSNITLDTNVTIDGGVVSITGDLTVDNLNLNGNALTSTSGNITLTPIAGSNITLDTNVTIDGGVVSITGDLSVDNLNLNGNTIISTDTNGNINLTPNGTGDVVISKADINSGAIDSTTIGSGTASTGAFTTLSTSGATTIGGSVNFQNNAMTNVNIDSGSIDGTPVGAASPSTGDFTTIRTDGKDALKMDVIGTSYSVTATGTTDVIVAHGKGTSIRGATVPSLTGSNIDLNDVIIDLFAYDSTFVRFRINSQISASSGTAYFTVFYV